MSASNYAENKVLDHLLATSTYTKPAGVFLALFTADPGEDGSGPEIAGLGYVRQATQFSASVNGIARNTSLITFPPATGGAWGTITHFGVYDALSAGNLLVSGAFTTPRVISDTDALLVNANDLAISLD